MIVNLDSTSTAGNINRLSDSKFQAFPIFWLLPENGSNLVIFAITCQNNLFPGGAGGGGWVPPHWIVKQLRHSDSTAGSRTKDLTLQALEESCIQTEGPSFEKTLRGSQKWCQLVPVLAPYLEAVYRKPTLRTQKIRLLGQTQIHYTSLTDRRKAENIYRFRQVGVSRSTLLFTNMAERLATHWACITDKQKKKQQMSCMVMSCIYTIQVTLSDCNDTSAGLSENIKKLSCCCCCCCCYICTRTL